MFEKMDPKKKRNLLIGLKAGKALSNALGTSPTETPDVELPEVPAGDKDDNQNQDNSGEQQYNQSDQPNGGSLGEKTPRQAFSGSYRGLKDPIKRRRGY
jgi:hypothetical protein